jgi:glycosyltransferase involved in cell wall biosynthesis
VRPEDRAAVAPFCAALHTVPLGRPDMAWGLARAFGAGRPLQVGLFDVPAMRRAADALLAEQRYDLVHVQLLRMAPHFESATVPRVIDLVDALSMNMERRRDRDRAPLRWLADFEARRLLRYERRICRAWGRATVVSAADCEAIGDIPGVTVNPNGVDLAQFPFAPGPRPAHRIAFTGNLGYFPSVDAVVWFVEEVLPRVWREVPQATLHLAGARPSRALRRLAVADPRIVVTGPVPDLAAHLASCGLAIAPLQAGSGQLLKVLEAMAAGTPVVATSLATSGFAVEADRHCLVADTPDAFARQVLRLMNDPALAARLAAEARHLVERYYTWEHSVDALEAVYDAALVEGRRSEQPEGPVQVEV